MNRKMISVITIVVVFVISGLLIFNNVGMNGKKSNNSADKSDKYENVNLSTNAFTIGDNSTDVRVKIENLNDNDVVVNEISVILYDSNKKVVATKNQEISLNLKSKESQVVNVIFGDKYLDVVDFKYEIVR